MKVAQLKAFVGKRKTVVRLTTCAADESPDFFSPPPLLPDEIIARLVSLVTDTQTPAHIQEWAGRWLKGFGAMRDER